mgnify:FL=1
MNMSFSTGEELPVDLLAATEELYTEAAEDLIRVMSQIKSGDYENAKLASSAVRDLKAAFYLVMDERTKVDKLRKQATGAVGTGTLDMDAARDEIGRRLARLRDAAAG